VVKDHQGAIRGFTLIEVMFATMLLTIVGAGIASFLSAMAGGSEARRSICDPALESALALRRFRSIAPEFRFVLRVRDDEVLVWMSDFVPSRSVHASEAGILRIDETEGVLLLETVDPAYLDRNRAQEREYLANQYQQLSDHLNSLRAAGALVTTVVAEGIDAVAFNPDPDEAGGVRITFMVESHETTFLLMPAPPEEPIG
jgi:prepilin-type N-terminal cleavage/methylation domain-containing protein